MTRRNLDACPAPGKDRPMAKLISTQPKQLQFLSLSVIMGSVKKSPALRTVLTRSHGKPAARGGEI